ncbi:serine O-acetyltransferase [Rhizobium lentis]|uniref:serine O-acetyltransferase n=1 Tax=Rhizobium TaxID=379 RepID=UPI00161F4A29|nr:MULTISPECIES: serine O-acetyltransferase [Rhizobium]MBB3350593.1 serine O-acetyltransferase [Rhizobium sp. BK049]MBX5131835.1 serine O-acetyltransferase [Rhizobium lentis]MBX5150792.1 serine O-acetyltransferase [Rhizobium lentis]MBX5175621.1 serine O-acetyltransferase [Rhizobium lentis]
MPKSTGPGLAVQQPQSSDGGSVWTVIRAEAGKLAGREPMLRRLLAEQVTDTTASHEILARVLAARLAVAHVETGDLFDLILSTLDDDIMRKVEADLAAVRDRDPACTTFLHALLNLKGFHALQTHRVAHALWSAGRREIATWLANLASLVFGPDIHPAAQIGASIMLDHGSGIVIGETAVIEDEVSILQNVTLGGTGKETGDRHPKIRHGVMIGAGAKILGNIEIGAFSKIAAGSVVLKPVPEHCTVAGVPATVVRIHRGDEIPAEMMDQNI